MLEFFTASRLHYNFDDVFKAFSLPYKDTDFRLAIFVPRRRFGLKEAKEKASVQQLLALIGSLKERNVTVSVQKSENNFQIRIPRFEVDHETNLREQLETLGIRRLFEQGEAELQDVAWAKISMDRAIHRSYFKVHLRV